MALIKSVTTLSGITVNTAYARIDYVGGSKNNLNLAVCYYVDQQSYLDNKSPLEQKQYSFVPSVDDTAANFIKQGYEYLKTLPEFAGAIDA